MTIQESDIVRYDFDRQTEIRAQISQWLRSGHKAKYLMLSERGTVLLDREAIETDHLNDCLLYTSPSPRD